MIDRSQHGSTAEIHMSISGSPDYHDCSAFQVRGTPETPEASTETVRHGPPRTGCPYRYHAARDHVEYPKLGSYPTPVKRLASY